jgi:feruloyl-CoA synthase
VTFGSPPEVVCAEEVGMRLAPVIVEVERRGERLYLRSGHALGAAARSLGDLLEAAAARAPKRRFLIERTEGGLVEVTYAQALAAAEGIGERLIEMGVVDPILVLSGNSVAHALLMLGAHLAGVPVAPVSPAYSLMSRDFGKLRHVCEKLQPGLVFAEQTEPHRRAIDACALGDVPLWDAAALRRPFDASAPRLAARRREVGPETVAKILFTSGSTGVPKGVPSTHRMLCSNQQQIAQLWPFLADEPPVLVDWLPWSHCFGGSHNFYMVLSHVGTLWIDEGKPSPALFPKSLDNLRALSPTLYFNVPAGFAALVPHLEGDADLCARFFDRLEVVFYAGAALPDDLWQRLTRLARDTVGRVPFMTTAWGSTETSPLATSAHFPLERAGNIGVPAPGVELALVPTDDAYEVRVKGPNVMAGYLGEPELSAAAFDEEGFYRIGDAVTLADPTDPAAGLLFVGRVVEDFKLGSGTWVHVNGLRTGLVAEASPVLQDLVVAGQDRAHIGVLAWPSLPGVARLIDEEVTFASACDNAEVRQHLRDAVLRWNAAHPGNSTAVARVLLLPEPPDADAGEITDKGYVNQRATLRRRAADVERLFGDAASGTVIVIE